MPHTRTSHTAVFLDVRPLIGELGSGPGYLAGVLMSVPNVCIGRDEVIPSDISAVGRGQD